MVEALLDAPRRFRDLRAALPGIAPNILSQRLRQLQSHGVVVARAYSERPPRVLYELSEEGQALGGTLRQLADWGARHGERADPPVHPACGSPLQSRWFCPTCEQATGRDEDALRYV